MESDQRAEAARQRALHADGVFVLPNAWDAGSAAPPPTLALLSWQRRARGFAGARSAGRREPHSARDGRGSRTYRRRGGATSLAPAMISIVENSPVTLLLQFAWSVRTDITNGPGEFAASATTLS